MDENPTTGRTVQLFLADGTPNGLVIASLFGWTGSILVGTQATFAKMLQRPELDRTGVYILFGEDSELALKNRVYVGEGTIIRSRINRSAKEHDFWEKAIVITVVDDVFSKGHSEYIEARIIEIAKSNDRILLDNSQEPELSRRRLPEADRANMEYFIENLRSVLPLVGIDLLKGTRGQGPRSSPGPTQGPSPTPGPSPDIPPGTTSNSEVGSLDIPVGPRFEIRHGSGISATAMVIDGEFVVLKGSRARRDTENVGRTYAALKQKLVDAHILIPTDDNINYEFSENCPFSSPSAAAAIVLDRNANGRTEWKVSGTVQTYQQWQEQGAKLEDIGPEA